MQPKLDFLSYNCTELVEYKDLNNKVVFITGGGSGIGSAFVKAFLEQGAKVGFISIDKSEGEFLVNHLNQIDLNQVVFIHGDVRNIGQLQDAMKTTEEYFSQPISVLVNNAARDDRHQLSDLSPEQWDDALQINLKPFFFTAQMMIQRLPPFPQLKEDSLYPSIINVGSNSSILGLSGYPAYVASKAGIQGLTKALARELGPKGVRVNTLIPGWVMTEKQKSLWVTEESLSECLKQQCIPQEIQTLDIALSCLFLASNASSMMTGQSIVVDGGRC